METLQVIVQRTCVETSVLMELGGRVRWDARVVTGISGFSVQAS